MKRLIRYQCEYCKKLFATPDRHNCKYNPLHKNCYTCANNKGFFKEEDSDGFSRIYRYCVECDFSDYDAQDLSREKYNIQCEYYTDSGVKWFENEHAKEKFNDMVDLMKADDFYE